MAESAEAVTHSLQDQRALSDQPTVHPPLLNAELTSERVTNSPRLSRKARDEAVAENETNGEDPDNYPLNTPWTFWHDMSPRGGTSKDFFANLKSLCTVKTIKAFWGVVNNIRPVEELGERESYHLMRNENRRPIWEDVDNADGGLWTFKVRKDDTAVVWQELLLAAVGEQFSDCVAENDDVCGVSVRIRGFDQNVIQIWNQDSELHYKASVIQRVKELVPTIEFNEFYQSNRAKMRDSLSKPPTYHRGVSPPPPMHNQRRYSGAPPPMHRMFPPRPPPPGVYPPPPGMYPPQYRQFNPRQYRPVHRPPHPPS